jgi:N-acetylglucosamine-6-sulfatase
MPLRLRDLPPRAAALIVTAAALAAGLAGRALAPSAEAAGETSNGRPNIVLIQTDDQSVRQFKQRVMPRTTKLLVKRGTMFSDYIATTAQCCPSRASLITGQYAHNNGVFANGGDRGGYKALRDKENVLPVWLQETGYRTAHVGKWMNNYGRAVSHPSEVAPGWDEWQTLFTGSDNYFDYTLSNNGRKVHYGERKRDYVTRVLTRKSVRTVRQFAKSRAPFYLQLDQRAPHAASGPGRCGNRMVFARPDPQDVDKFDDAKLPKPPSFNEKRMGDKPAFLRGSKKIAPRERRLLRARWRCALASLVAVDRSVKRVYNAVKESGELRRTVFIFISDNGFFYGEHRLVKGKLLPYEEALRLPLVMTVPRRYRDGASKIPRIREPVANIDLAPTILDLAGAEACPPSGSCRTMDGRSLMPLITRSGGWPRDRALLTEYDVQSPGKYATCRFFGIRTHRTIYVEHKRVADKATGNCERARARERYTLQRDPFELRNRCHGGSPRSCPSGSGQQRLERRLGQLRDCTGIAGRDAGTSGRPFCD